MARKVSLADLQAREAQAQARLARERQALARLKKQTAQAERTARLARWGALGEAVEATWGAITPAELLARLRTIAGDALPVPGSAGATPTPTEACDVHDPLAALAHVVQAILTGSVPAAWLIAVPAPHAPRNGTRHMADHGATLAEASTDVRCTLHRLALLVQDARTGHLPASALTALLRTLPAHTAKEQTADMASGQNGMADTANGTPAGQAASVQIVDLRDTAFLPNTGTNTHAYPQESTSWRSRM